MDADAQRLLRVDQNLFDFPHLTYVQSSQESKALNRRKGPFVVIAASGMCEHGRILHHLKNSISEPENTVLIIGFQAQHTLGRRLVDRHPRVRIFDREYQVRAKIEKLNGLSAHADAEDFKWWFEQMAADGGVGQTFLVHGEPEAARALASTIADYCDEEPIIPALYESFEV
jgi:metallo-beta-lactamase family protein